MVKGAKRKLIYIAPLLQYLTLKALRYGSHNVTCKLHRTCIYLVSIHQTAHPKLRLRTSNCSLLLIYLPGKDGVGHFSPSSTTIRQSTI